MTEPGARIVFFGTFYPRHYRAGNSSTGIVTALSRSDRVERIVVFAPHGSGVPPGARADRIDLRMTWQHDSVVGLALTYVRMLRAARSADEVLFNMYVTSFGRSPAANALGLLLPSMVAKLSRRPVRVYMHNFLETQDVEQLGYRPSRLVRWSVRTLERWLVGATRVAVPLKSQQAALRRVAGFEVDQLLLPYIESLPGAYTLLEREPSPATDAAAAGTGRLRVLLFGTWGPQKDLVGVVRVLDRLIRSGMPLDVTVAGSVNPSFPEYAQELDRLRVTTLPPSIRFLGAVPETDVLRLTFDHDVLILPYHATGGYSGAMNLGALAGIGIVAYDLPQLREFADDLGIVAQFVPAGDLGRMREALGAELARGRGADQGRDGLRARLERTLASVERLAGVDRPRPTN
ncbi:MAG TPA: hypothetical protein VFF67_02185 [Thermoplasmata archaeon]|nr:hypothetical protein [Thermoplasmata archaeon]